MALYKRGRGFIVVTMAVGAVALCGALGLAVDLGRMFIAKNETQAYTDAASLAATLKLNGTVSGINNADAAAAATGNAWNLDSAKISGSTVEFATSIDGPWDPNPTPATGYRYTRVRATVPVQLYFLPFVVAKYGQDVASAAIAGQTPETSFRRGLGPFTVVSTDPTTPYFGLVIGDLYDIQWPQYNGSRAGCSPSNPDKCFVSPPCTDDPKVSRGAVVQYWGASTNGYWGGNAASGVYGEILDLIQLQTVKQGDLITMNTGDKATEAKALDIRVNEDMDVVSNNVPSYEANPLHNGRRLIALPVVQPTVSGTYVLGYGAFLLLSNGKNSNYYEAATGNEPFCAVYAGCYVVGGTDPGACATGGGAGQSGAFRVALVR